MDKYLKKFDLIEYQWIRYVFAFYINGDSAVLVDETKS